MEYVVLDRALRATDPNGYPIILGDFLLSFKEKLADTEDGEVVDAMKRLCPRFLALRKYDSSLRGFRDYADDDHDFFYRGDFRLKSTPFTRSRLEELAAELPLPEPEKRPIGFKP
jgi:hypothetical protein